MTIPVLVQQQGSDQFRATVIGLPDCQASATSREDAITEVRSQIVNLQNGQEGSCLVFIEVEEPEKPSTAGKRPWQIFGRHRNDRTWGEIFDRIDREREDLDRAESQAG